MIKADPHETPDNDCVSALLRCVYNHTHYPRRKPVDRLPHLTSVVPLVIRLQGNQARSPTLLLDMIESKGGGAARVLFKDDPDPFVPKSEAEQLLLVAHLPNFEAQKGQAGGASDDEGSSDDGLTTRRKAKPKKQSAAAKKVLRKKVKGRGEEDPEI